MVQDAVRTGVPEPPSNLKSTGEPNEQCRTGPSARTCRGPPITAALYIAAEGVNPKGTDQLITTTAIALKVLPVAPKHSAQPYISGSLTELALGAVAV
jgi:hypothetical protein